MRKLLIKLKKIYCRGGYFSCQSIRDYLSDYRLFQLKSASIGSILIEFVFCVPVIIILLFFVNDHFRYYELKSKVKTSAYLAASMAQQYGNTLTNKQLTGTNLKRIHYASFMNFFIRQSMWSPFQFGVRPRIHWMYVKRVSPDNYECQIIVTGYNSSYSASTLNILYDIYNNTFTAGTVATLSPDLICNANGEERVLVWAYWLHNSSTNFNKSKLGFFIIPLQTSTNNDTSASIISHFSHKVVFTPKPGLFPVKNE